ncbi:DUF6959 family protein [Saccharothrix sp. ST-888]|uniref:DUF6959 family protein n=1 Tax=Saccharothrix sp. ST-888 TaxID=1427391 RepID=UPI0005EC1EB2|nr:hypothetical protein [Saccharothrix sp. ST-888]KJK57621.1 hypothetical protein UK12_15450 [Saccharothrix sp. ST-888]
MERIDAELFDAGGNDAIVRLPGRRFPGVLIQGDSLMILRESLAEVQELCVNGETADALEALAYTLEELDGRLERYRVACAAHGMNVPW